MIDLHQLRAAAPAERRRLLLDELWTVVLAAEGSPADALERHFDDDDAIAGLALVAGETLHEIATALERIAGNGRVRGMPAAPAPTAGFGR